MTLFHGTDSRLVVPGYAHHVTQRGNRRMETFFGDVDFPSRLESLTRRDLQPRRPGRPRMRETDA